MAHIKVTLVMNSGSRIGLGKAALLESTLVETGRARPSTSSDAPLTERDAAARFMRNVPVAPVEMNSNTAPNGGGAPAGGPTCALSSY